MTSRERVRLVLDNKLPDRLPFNFWMDRDLMEEFDRRFGDNFRITHYGADVIETFPGTPFFAEFAGKAEVYNDGKTVWTIKHAASSITELENTAFYDPDNPLLYQNLKNDRAKYPDKALFALTLTPLDCLFGLIGMEQFFYDIADYGEIVEDIAEKMSEVICRQVKHIADCDVDVLYLAGDICSTKGPIMSANDIRRFCFGPVKKVIDRAHECGLKVFYHTDGNVMDILPLFVEFGFDGINPFQHSAGNDPDVFLREYGDKLMVYGGMDNCFIIPDGSEQDVREHILRLFRTLGKNGRFIASSHDIPTGVPLGNVDVMVETIKSCVY